MTAFKFASATANATSSMNMTMPTPAITASVTRASFTTVTTAALASRAPYATLFIPPMPKEETKKLVFQWNQNSMAAILTELAKPPEFAAFLHPNTRAVTLFEYPMCPANFTLPTTDSTAVSSIDVGCARFSPYDAYSAIAHGGLSAFNKLAKNPWMLALMLLAILAGYMCCRRTRLLELIKEGRLYDLRLRVSPWTSLSIRAKVASTKNLARRQLNTVKAAHNRVSSKVHEVMLSKMLRWFNIDLTPPFLNGQPNAFKVLNATSPPVVAEFQNYTQTSPSENCLPEPPVEAAPPEPREESESPEGSQSDLEITPSDDLMRTDSQSDLEITPSEDLIRTDSHELTQTPEPIDEQQDTGPSVIANAHVERDSQQLEPMTKREEVYIWNFNDMADTLRTLTTFPVEAPELSNSLLGRVAFIRAHKISIELQTSGSAYIREMTEKVNKGIEDMTASTSSASKNKLSDLRMAVEKLEATFIKQCDLERLTKEIEFIDGIHLEGGFEKRGAWLKYNSTVSSTAKHLTKFLANKEDYMETFLRDVIPLCETYSNNVERIPAH